MKKDTIIKHNSFGNISITKSFGGERHLYGSSIEHRNSITLKITHSELHRNLNYDWYYPTSPIVEISLSPSQFAEAITSIGDGNGVPCTIRYTEKDGKAEDTPFESKYDIFKQEFAEHIDNIKKETVNIRNEIADLFKNKKAIGKTDRELILKKIDSIIQDVGSNTKFIQKQFQEQMDKTVTEAKAEIEAFTQNKITNMGLEAIRQEIISLPEINNED